MSENLFEKKIREKLYDFSIPGETGDWEALAARMSGRKAFLRRRRVLILIPAAAACLLLLMFLLMPVTDRKSLAPVTVCHIVPQPASLELAVAPGDIPALLSQQGLELLRSRSVIPATSEITTPADMIPSPEIQQATPPQVAMEEPAVEKVMPVEIPPKAAATKTNGLYPDGIPKNPRLNRKWITAANFSYQGAINGAYLFTPSTYTTKWETPLSLASSDLSNLGIPDDMAPDFTEDDRNQISAHFSTPISAGINVQKEFNKWLSVGVSLTYTLLRGEYQVHTADKSYIVNQNTHYLGIPISIYLRMVNTPHLTVYAVGGGAMDRAIADEYFCQLNDVTTHQYVPVQGFQWSLYGGLGIEYKWSELMGIYIEPAVSHYFDNNQPKSIRTVQPTQFRMELGIRFRI